MLQSFCQYSNKTLIGSIENFYVNQFISAKLLTPNEFQNQIESFIQDFQRETISSFQRNLDLIIDITLGNQLMSIYETNWYFILDPNGNFPIYTKSRSYGTNYCFILIKMILFSLGNCSCGTPKSLYCIDQLSINDNTTVDGMFIGCLPITSLRLSSLRCFYDQICLDKVADALYLKNLSIISLDPSRINHYATNTTLNHLIDNLMLEEWENEINYTVYFNECAIKQCTYLVSKKENPLVIFTTLLSLCKSISFKYSSLFQFDILYEIDGGLTIALGFLAPNIVRITRYLRSRSIAPQS